MLFIPKESINSKIEIKKSIFISYIFYVDNKEKINEIIKKYKVKFKDSTHLVYGFRLGTISSFSQGMSDGYEPHLTAGKPTLDAIILSKLTDTLIITIRYFGGTLLGKGGLIRAYSEAAKQVIFKTSLGEKQELEILSLSLDYNKYNYLIKNKKKLKFEIIDSNFLDKIQTKIKFNKKDKNKIESFLIENITNKI